MNPQLIQLACILKGLKIVLQPGSETKSPDKGKPEKTFPRLLDQALGSAKGSLSPKALGAKIGVRAEQSWLDLFRNQLLTAGISLKDLSLSPKAMPELKKLLLAEGFSEADVKHFLEGLFGGHGRREVKITELLEKLSELKALSDKKSRGPALEAAVVPHVDTLLRFLGLNVEQANNVISKSRLDDGGLSLKSLVQNLKVITDKFPKGTKLAVSQQSVQEIKALLARIGILDKTAKIKGPVSLEQFAQIIEKKVASLMPHRLSEGEAGNYVKTLLGHVLIVSEEQGPKSTARRRYTAKLRGLPHDGLKGNRAHHAHKQIAQGCKEAASEVTKAPTKAEGLAALHPDKNELFHKMEKLVEPVRGRAFEKMPDQKNGTAAHSGKEAVIGRVSVSETFAKQGPRPLPLHVIDQVGRQLGLALKRGDNQVRIQLKPPQLGSIQLDMTLKDNMLKVAMIAEHHSVKEVLMSHVHELREALVEQGVELQKIDVEINHNFGRSMANAHRNLNGPHSGRGGLTSVSSAAENAPMGTDETTPAHIRSDALVDMFA